MFCHDIIRRLEVLIQLIESVIAQTVEHIVERKVVVFIKLILASGIEDGKRPFVNPYCTGTVIHFVPG